MPRSLMLLSCSKLPGQPQRLEYAAQHIKDFFSGGTRPVENITLVPYAGETYGDAYFKAFVPPLEELGFKVRSVHAEKNPVAAIRQAEGICVGGGNTYLLNDRLHSTGLREAIRERVLEEGVPYLGWSAGSNVAFSGIAPTNDWNIVRTATFEGLSLIEGGLRLNPHFADPIDWQSLSPEAQRAADRLLKLAPETAAALKPQGEAREDRIVEFLAVNDGPVLGLYEGGVLLVNGNRMTLSGTAGAKLFRRGLTPEKFEPGTDLSTLLAEVEGMVP